MVTLHQFAILALFETFPQLAYEEAMRQTGLTKVCFDAALKGLLSPTVANSVLLKQDHRTPVFQEKELLRLNPEFVSAHIKRSFVPAGSGEKQATKKPAAESNSGENESIAKERMYATDALLMKIMKVFASPKDRE